MQIFFFSIFALIFGFINYKIIISDQKTKKIPNKFLLQLLFLLPFWYIFLYFFGVWNFEIFPFILQIFLSFLISFLLYNFGIWRAWDAKYLLVLSLFIPHIWIISFIGNLGLFTLFYLFLYFLWFFFGKSLIYKWYFSSLIKSIKTDLEEKWKFYKKSKKWSNFSIIFKWIFIFLIIFVSLRLARIYLFLEFFQNFSINENILQIFQKYHFYMIFAGIWLTIWIYYIWKKIINFLKIYFAEKFRTNLGFIWNIFIGITFFALILFIFYEFQKNPEEIRNYLIKIFTIYILIYIFAKIIFYSYKLSFLTSEEKFIHIDNLKTWNIVDKKYLNKMFGTQDYLRNKIGIKYTKFDPEKYFLEIKNPIDLNTKDLLQKIYKTVNFEIENNKNKKKFFEKNYNIKILKTFSFGIYIFLGFLITFIFRNEIINFITKKIIDFISL